VGALPLADRRDGRDPGRGEGHPRARREGARCCLLAVGRRARTAPADAWVSRAVRRVPRAERVRVRGAALGLQRRRAEPHRVPRQLLPLAVRAARAPCPRRAGGARATRARAPPERARRPRRPTALLRVAFWDGERFEWNPLLTTISHIIIGRLTISHTGGPWVRAAPAAPRRPAAAPRFGASLRGASARRHAARAQPRGRPGVQDHFQRARDGAGQQAQACGALARAAHARLRRR